MPRNTLRLALPLVASVLTGPALAQSAQAPAIASSMDQMRTAMQTMDKNMMAGMQAGTPDQIFAAMMIPHHQGAVDMSRISLRDIKDPELRRMAEKTASENEANIKELQAWQRKHR